ncbi:MAG TPA: YqgE/AlgH family protein [Rhodopirellula baltica]|uniref:Probable transcriptional regulator n=1 Tax=Rhodopirellula baltica (strain DSM 10527 / NCIMB 13988 / SH1) TaxID=243090 RepID=Q7URG7_RHOBA|nr:YqgE/AlgH family protein [Rhodopirellula baltica]CAD74371.1 probable transcriptional regulator [Rhodopirellula baltica SH 1]HBE61319.1 YqgE/AlgH family protein [Rhodopirellula baltica]
MKTSQNCTGCFLIASPYLHDGNFFRSVVLIIRHTHEGAFGVVINRAGPQRFGDVIEMSDPSWQASSGPDMSSLLASQAESASLGDASDPNKTNESLQIHPDQIYLGGPVNGPVLALHNIAGIGDPCGVDIGEGAENDPAGSKTQLHDHPAEPWGSMSIQWADVPAWVTSDEDHLRLLARRDDAKLRYVVGYSGWGPMQLESELEEGGWLITPADTDSIFGPCEEVWEKLVRRCGQAIMKDLTPDVPFPSEQQGFDPGVN